MGRFVTSLKTTGDRCLISLPCSPGSLRNLPEGNPARLITHKGSNKIGLGLTLTKQSHMCTPHSINSIKQMSF